MIGQVNTLTLLDYPGKTAATVFISGCNFRCPFCYNGSLAEDRLPADEQHTVASVLAFLKARRGLLDGVCISGGEALLWDDLPAFIRFVKTMGYAVKLDTNGSFPKRLRALLSEGLLDYVAMDVKNDPMHYAETVGLATVDLAAIQASMTLLKDSGLPFEFRTTVVKEFHTPDRLLSLARWIGPVQRYFLQAFKDEGDLLQAGLHSLSEKEMEACLTAVRTVCPRAERRG